VCLRKLSNTKQGRQSRYVTFWRHRIITVAMNKQKQVPSFYCRPRQCQQYKSAQCCHGNAKMLSLCTCPAARYFALLLIILHIMRVCVCVCVCVRERERVLNSLPGMQIASFPAPYYVMSYVACLALSYFPTLSHKWHDFQKLTAYKILYVLTFSTTFFPQNFSL
jgi:hypothetical protein